MLIRIHIYTPLGYSSLPRERRIGASDGPSLRRRDPPQVFPGPFREPVRIELQSRRDLCAPVPLESATGSLVEAYRSVIRTTGREAGGGGGSSTSILRMMIGPGDF